MKVKVIILFGKLKSDFTSVLPLNSICSPGEMAGFALLVQEEGGKYGHKEKRVVRDRNRLKEGEAEEKSWPLSPDFKPGIVAPFKVIRDQ